MSAGCVHQKASVILALGFGLGSLAFHVNGAEYAIGALVGIMLTPDLDVDNGYIGNAHLRRIGLWADKGWDVLWYFYRRSLKHGRELSHFPVISTMFRLAYLFLLFLVVPYCVFAVALPGAWNVWSELAWWLALGAKHYKLILGLMGSDLIHWGLDVLTTEHAKQKKKELFGLPLQSSVCK